MLDVSDAIAHVSSTRDLRRVDAHPDHWYPLAWSRDVKPLRPYAARFSGQPIVLVRPKEGPVFALEDRCAHRQVPLSEGVVTGCAIRCCYHGWTYDAAGACIDVPYLGKGKAPNGVRAYPCCERDGLVLVWPGDPRAVTPLGPLGAAADPRFKTRRFGQEVRCHYTFMHENLMDMNHQFLHRRQMGQIAPRYLGRRVGEDWLEIDYSFARTAGKQPLGEAVILGGRRSLTENPVHRDLMTIRTEYPHQSLRIWTSGDEPVMHLWIGYTPVDAEQRLNRTFGLLSVRRPKIPGLLDLAWPALIWFTNRIFAEDRRIVELEQAAHDSQGADWNQEVFPPIRELRALLAANGRPSASGP
ncbi:MAG: ferredoxin [Rhodospirillales bacterium]|jgi:phenylpropionate dioxygenase-like ring-hydroxylating dioxygenase large terminal subunit|nr:ferredoxin [Rhodospirillales bacterium]